MQRTIPLTAGGEIMLAHDGNALVTVYMEQECSGEGAAVLIRSQVTMTVPEMQQHIAACQAVLAEAIDALVPTTAPGQDERCTLGQGGPLFCQRAVCECRPLLGAMS
jgi:hypothetical protein